MKDRKRNPATSKTDGLESKSSDGKQGLNESSVARNKSKNHNEDSRLKKQPTASAIKQRKKNPATSKPDVLKSKSLDGQSGVNESAVARNLARKQKVDSRLEKQPTTTSNTRNDHDDATIIATIGSQTSSMVIPPPTAALRQERRLARQTIRPGAVFIHGEHARTEDDDDLQHAPEEDYPMSSRTLQRDSTIMFEGELIPEADVLQPANEGDRDDERRQQRRWLLLTSVVGVVLLVVSVGIGVAMRGNNNSEVEEPSQPSLSPTLTPSFQPSESLASRIISYSPWTTFDDPGSGQKRALDWISTDDRSLAMESEKLLFLQRFALAVLFFATNGEMWGNQPDPSNFIDECADQSVEKNPPYLQCDEEGFVTEIDLDNIDNLPPCDYVTGTLPPELALLSRLTSFRAPNNEWTGSLPTPLGFLTALQTLDLNVMYSSGLSGSLPSEIGNITELEMLNLGGHRFDLPLPFEVWRLTNLTHLALGTEANDHASPYPSEVGLLTGLTTLSLNSGLSGTIPTELGQLTQARKIDFSWDVTGTLPSELGRLTELDDLLVRGSPGFGLVGCVPSEFGHLTMLTEIDLWLTGLTGQLPSEIGLMTSLVSLNFDHTAPQSTSSPLPSEFGSLTGLKLLHITGILSGTLPTELGLLASLAYLGLNRNRVVGPIPTELFSLTEVSPIELSMNDLQTSIPSEIGLWRGTSLSLALEQSNLTGTIPTELSTLTELSSLHLGENPRLTGQLPEMRDLKVLSVLTLDGTGLSDTIDCGRFPGVWELALWVDFDNVGTDIKNCENEPNTSSSTSSYCYLSCSFGVAG